LIFEMPKIGKSMEFESEKERYYRSVKIKMNLKVRVIQ